jgi:hypothetical protein
MWEPLFVIPTKAGIQPLPTLLAPGSRRGDGVGHVNLSNEFGQRTWNGIPRVLYVLGGTVRADNSVSMFRAGHVRLQMSPIAVDTVDIIGIPNR